MDGQFGAMTCLNPLHHVVMIADLNRRAWLKMTCGDKNVDLGERWMVPLPPMAIAEPFPVHEGRTIYPNAETVGIVGSYQQIEMMPGYEVIFCNDLAYEVCGIDVIAKHRETGRYLICEAKGTAGPIGSPATYLKSTKTKGRQLSWQWVWNSLIDFASSPTASSVFLELYRPMILQKRIDRILSVSNAEITEGGYMLGKIQIWTEAELFRYPWLAVNKDWEKLRGWLCEMDNRELPPPLTKKLECIEAKVSDGKVIKSM